MSLSKKKEYILNIVQKDPGLGKTALMKIMFMLQEVKEVKIGYEFSIYTYGPYDTSLMEDIDELSAAGLLMCTMYPYQTYVGYALDITEKGKELTSQLSGKEARDLDNIIQFAKGKSAKELELYSTIVYIEKLFRKNSWDTNSATIAKKVHDIKPHFSNDTILGAYGRLQEMKYI